MDCNIDLVVAYNLVKRCKESDVLFRSQLNSNKDGTRQMTYGYNKSYQWETGLNVHRECIYAEPITDLSTLNNEQLKKLEREESESLSSYNNDNDDDDYKEAVSIIQENASESENVTNLENDAIKSKVDESISEVKQGVEEVLSSFPKRCCKCKMRLENMEQVEQHSKTHIGLRVVDQQIITTSPFECSVCFQRFTTNHDLFLHQQEMSIDKQFQDDEPDKDLLKKAPTANYKKPHYKNKIDRKGQLPKCCACYQEFESDELLKKHCDEIHLPESQASTSNNGRKIICDICHRRYKTKRTMLDHQLKPYRINNHQCVHCGRVFREISGLADHERSHFEERSFVCPICSRSYTRKDSYRRHVKLHSVEKDHYKCDVCGKGCRSKDNLNVHMRMHTGEKRFKCHMCDAVFAYPDKLKRHIMAHRGIKPHRCNVCEMEFTRSDHLSKHMKSHLNTKRKSKIISNTFDCYISE
ncbi:zinc finger protein 883-like isoform X2 [Toxorhynchites rutilus septentrionalis]|nr:zinc finger protein 883-like isoform X2 [Toxorhynchites rutilus septentrionalis]